MGFAVTRPAARQLVSHRGVTVNGKSVNLPSYQVKAGDAIALSERAQKQLRVQESLTVSQQMDLLAGVGRSRRARSSLACSRRCRIVPTCRPTSTKR